MKPDMQVYEEITNARDNMYNKALQLQGDEKAFERAIAEAMVVTYDQVRIMYNRQDGDQPLGWDIARGADITNCCPHEYGLSDRYTEQGTCPKSLCLSCWNEALNRRYVVKDGRYEAQRKGGI